MFLSSLMFRLLSNRGTNEMNRRMSRCKAADKDPILIDRLLLPGRTEARDEDVRDVPRSRSLRPLAQELITQARASCPRG
jgi:hypothetical protein